MFLHAYYCSVRNKIFIGRGKKEEKFGENTGKIKAGYPTCFDEETGSDAIELGYFNTIEEAMAAVINSNHPDYGTHC